MKTQEKEPRRARLIKRGDAEKKAAPKETRSGATATIQDSVTAVRAWIKTRQTASHAQARQMFSSLFVQPQPE